MPLGMISFFFFCDGIFVFHNRRNAFLGLQNLHILHYDENVLKKFDNFQVLVSLTTLLASSNRITDLNEVIKLSELPTLQHVCLMRTPISQRANYRMCVVTSE
jgi:Leucine-rich repeat (LRR) protein